LYFLDASALAKAYLSEGGTQNVKGVLDFEAGKLFISEFVALEVLTSIRIALRTATRTQFQIARDEFWADYPNRFTVLEVDPPTRAAALELTTKHRDARARSMDVLHLATALRLQSGRRSRQVTMITSDRDLADLARVCGLRTFDPAREPLAALPLRRR
jgi:predicted nucleic acid-binding protein